SRSRRAQGSCCGRRATSCGSWSDRVEAGGVSQWANARRSGRRSALLVVVFGVETGPGSTHPRTAMSHDPSAASPSPLPDPIVDRLFEVLYGPLDQRERELAALQGKHPEFREAILAHVRRAQSEGVAAVSTRAAPRVRDPHDSTADRQIGPYKL